MDRCPLKLLLYSLPRFERRWRQMFGWTLLSIPPSEWASISQRLLRRKCHHSSCTHCTGTKPLRFPLLSRRNPSVSSFFPIQICRRREGEEKGQEKVEEEEWMTFSNVSIKKNMQAALEAIKMLSSWISAFCCMNLHTFGCVRARTGWRDKERAAHSVLLGFFFVFGIHSPGTLLHSSGLCLGCRGNHLWPSTPARQDGRVVQSWLGTVPPCLCFSPGKHTRPLMHVHKNPRRWQIGMKTSISGTGTWRFWLLKQ